MNAPDEEDELLDIVDKNDRVIAIMPRSQVYCYGVHDFRCVNAIVRNPRGELWIPRRAAHKAKPLWLDTSMAGHVKSGETYEQAFVRETREELNIDTALTRGYWVGKLTPYEDDVPNFAHVYEILSDKEPDYNREDYCEAFWLKPSKVFERVRAGEPAKKDLLTILKKFYSEESP